MSRLRERMAGLEGETVFPSRHARSSPVSVMDLDVALRFCQAIRIGNEPRAPGGQGRRFIPRRPTARPSSAPYQVRNPSRCDGAAARRESEIRNGFARLGMALSLE